MSLRADLCCPTCGHCHPGGFGIGMCICEDCLLIWDSPRPDLLTPEYSERRQQLLREADRLAVEGRVES